MCLQECYNYDTIMMKTVFLSYKNGIVQRCGQCVKEAIQNENSGGNAILFYKKYFIR